jgi:acetyl-CoA carboxylase biotin carboxyl carrier protein
MERGADPLVASPQWPGPAPTPGLITYSFVTIEEIRELIQLVSDTGIAELEVQRGDNRVRIRKSFGSEPGIVLQSPGPAHTAAPATSGPTLKAETPPARADPQLFYAKSPIVGTFYEAASPETPPFVRIGEHVTPGKVLCIIESMKLMNEIEADVAGIVESKLVQNGQPVEYGEALFGIRPV